MSIYENVASLKTTTLPGGVGQYQWVYDHGAGMTHPGVTRAHLKSITTIVRLHSLAIHTPQRDLKLIMYG